MALTLGTTGMDASTEAELKAAFDQANARMGGQWRYVPEQDADHVIVDMDSMYGPMSWIRLHAAGKQVIGLTTSSRTQADFHLARPFDADSLSALLAQLGGDADAPAQDPARTSAPAGGETSLEAPPPSGMTPAPAPMDQLPEEVPVPVAEEVAPPPEPEPAPVPVAPAPAPEPVATEPPPPPRDPVLADWCAPGALAGRYRYRRAGGPALLINADARQYHGPAALKALAPYFDGVVRESDLEPVDDASWAGESAAAGAPQPLSRLQWLGALVVGKGRLLSGYDPDGDYRLLKWPQTEREYPKHFRIATAMMKGPARLSDIAAASGVSHEEVADFVNANLATGYAEFVPPPQPEPEEPPKPTGLFGRMRGR
jgi:hypothetical protein